MISNKKDLFFAMTSHSSSPLFRLFASFSLRAKKTTGGYVKYSRLDLASLFTFITSLSDGSASLNFYIAADALTVVKLKFRFSYC